MEAAKTELELLAAVPAMVSCVSVMPSPSVSVPQIRSTHSGWSMNGLRLY